MEQILSLRMLIEKNLPIYVLFLKLNLEYKNIDPHVLKYFDMPKPYIPNKKIKNKISTKRRSKSINQ